MEQTPDNEPFESDSTTNLQPDTTTQPDAAPLKVKKQRRGVHPAIVAVLVGIILLLGAAVVYLLFFDNTKDTSTDNQVTTPVKTALTAEQVVEKIKPELAGTQRVNSTEMSYYSAAAYKPDNDKYYVTPEDESGVGVTGSSDVVTTDFATIKKLLKDNEFKLVDDKSYTYTDEDQGTVYASSAVVCLASTHAAIDTADEATASLACADISSYVATAKVVSPFYDAYLAVTDKPVKIKASKLVFIGPNITESQTAGYKRADVGMASYGAPAGGSQGLFYQTPDNTWHYFTNTQELVPCSDYSTQDVKKAFVGSKCSDDAGQESTVSL